MDNKNVYARITVDGQLLYLMRLSPDGSFSLSNFTDEISQALFMDNVEARRVAIGLIALDGRRIASLNKSLSPVIVEIKDPNALLRLKNKRVIRGVNCTHITVDEA